MVMGKISWLQNWQLDINKELNYKLIQMNEKIKQEGASNIWLENIGSEYMINGNNSFRIFIYSHTKEKLEDLKQEISTKTEVKKSSLNF